MHPFDIISTSPNLYILQKSSNKTNFGGFLFLIYLVTVIIILVYYIIDYSKNDKYTIQYFSYFNVKTNEQKEEMKKEELFNPYINFNLTIYFKENEKEHNATKQFILYDLKKENGKGRNTSFKKRISDFDIVLFYYCKYKNCSDYENYLNKSNFYNITDSHFLRMDYDGFILDHQNSDKPIQKKHISFSNYFKLNLKKTSIVTSEWLTIKYTEKKGFFQKDSNDSCGYFQSSSVTTYDEQKKIFPTNAPTLVYICRINFEINTLQYTEYFRKRISEIDIIANILSLMANIFTGIKFIFSFYSNNFNNFKIIEKLLNHPTKTNYKINQASEMIDLEKNKFISIKDDLITKENNNIKENLDEDNNNDNGDDDINYNNQHIKKLRFFDFFLNNIYCCFKKRKAQKIIHECNEIVYKYASIDGIIKNQILMENFFKDYKWNNPSLNNVENNNLFIQLKTYL